MSKKILSLILAVCIMASVMAPLASAAAEHDKAWGIDFPSSALYMWFQPKDNYVSMQNPPDFKWHQVGPISDTVSYDLIICTDPELKNVKYRKDGIKYNFYNFDYPFETGVQYWWSVRYHLNGQISGWSDARRFRISPDAQEFLLPDTEGLLARVPKTHPRIHTTLEGLEEFRALADTDPNSKAVKDSIIAQADGYLRAPLDASEPEPYSDEFKAANGGWQNTFRNVCGPKYAHLIPMGYAYLLTGEKKYCDRAIEALMELSKWDPDGATGYAEQSQIHREIMLHMAQVYDWCYNDMTPEQRTTVVNHILSRAKDFEHLKDLITANPFQSHGWTQLGFMGVVGIALAGDHPKGDEFLSWVVPIYCSVLAPWSSQDGGWSQGTQYWQWSSNTNHDFTAPLAKAGIMNLYNKAWSSNEYKWTMYAFPAGSYGLFGDGQMDMSSNDSIRSVTTTAYFTKDPAAIWTANSFGRIATSRDSYYTNTVLDDSDYIPVDMPLANEFHDIGWITMLSDITDNDRIQLGFKASPYGSYNHSHPDQNAFIIQAYGEKLAIRSGYYPWYMSDHHKNFTHHSGSKNTITVDTSRGQVRQDMNATGHLTNFLTHEDFDLGSGDATDSYKGGLDKFERNIVYLRPDIFVIIDELDAAKSKKSKFEWWLNSETPMEVYKGDISGARITNGAGAIDAMVQYPKKVTSYYNDIFAVSDMVEWPAEPNFSQSTVHTRTWFETEPLEKTKMVVTLDVHRAGKEARFVDTEYFGDYMQMTFEDGSVILVNLTDDREKLIDAGTVKFKGVAVAYNDKTMMLVSGTYLEDAGIELIRADKTLSVVMGKDQLGISTYSDNTLSINVNNDYISSIESIKDYKGNPIGKEWGIVMEEGLMEKTDDGITLTENADYRTFTCELDNYNLYLNNNSLNTAPTPDTATIEVTIDGVKAAETVINGFVPVKGNPSYSGYVTIPSGKYKVVNKPDALSFAGVGKGEAAYFEKVLVKTESKDGNSVELETVPVVNAAIKETNEEGVDSNVLKDKLTYFVEAENGELAEGSAAYTTRSWLSGGKGVQYLNTPGQVSKYTFEIKEAGTYDIGVKYVAWDSDNAQRLFTLNGKEYLVKLPRTIDYGTKPENWKYIIADTGIWLEPGTYVIGIEPVEGSWNYDYLGLVKR